jgi:hypothetical protein
MAGYAYAVGRAAQTRRQRPGAVQIDALRQGGTSGGNLYPPILRLLVCAHVRDRLERFGARCAQISAALPPARNSARRAWLCQAREEAAQAASGLPSLRVPGFLALAPFALGVATLIGKASASHVRGFVWVIVVVVAAVVGFVVFHETYCAFREKREIFLDGASRLDRASAQEQQEVSGRNLYKDEDALFELLGSTAPREVQLDTAVISWSLFLLAEGVSLVPVLLPNAPVVILFGTLFLAAVAWIGLAVYDRRYRQRLWR